MPSAPLAATESTSPGSSMLAESTMWRPSRVVDIVSRSSFNCAATCTRRDSKHSLLVHRRHVGRSQVMRDADVRLNCAHQRLVRFTLQIPNDAPRHILDVKGAFAQIGIID